MENKDVVSSLSESSAVDSAPTTGVSEGPELRVGQEVTLGCLEADQHAYVVSVKGTRVDYAVYQERQVGTSTTYLDRGSDITPIRASPATGQFKDAPDTGWIGLEHGRVYSGPVKGTVKYRRDQHNSVDGESAASRTNERERCLELVKQKRDGNMRRTTGGYEPAAYFLNEADVRQVCNELIKEIESV